MSKIQAVGKAGAVDGRDRFIVKVKSTLGEQIRRLAVSERRPLNTQIEILLERGIASYVDSEGAVEAVA